MWVILKNVENNYESLVRVIYIPEKKIIPITKIWEHFIKKKKLKNGTINEKKQNMSHTLYNIEINFLFVIIVVMKFELIFCLPNLLLFIQFFLSAKQHNYIYKLAQRYQPMYNIECKKLSPFHVGNNEKWTWII